MTKIASVRAILLLLAVSGCPTRTVYYDAGSGTDAVNSGGRGAGGGANGEMGNAAAGAGGGGTAGQNESGGVEGSAGRNGLAGTSGSAGGGAGASGIAGAGGGATSCANTMTDAKNCGTCGHDCLGGTCSAGQCQPLMLAQYTGEADVIDVGATSVYVSTDLGYIGKVAKDGSDLKSPQMPSFVTSAFIGTHVFEDGDRAFFVWYGSTIQLAFCSSQSCEATITPIGGQGTQYFAVDPTDYRIAWIDYSPTRILVGPEI